MKVDILTIIDNGIRKQNETKLAALADKSEDLMKKPDKSEDLMKKPDNKGEKK